MPAQERDVHFRKQKAVLWAFVGYDAYGQPVVNHRPVEILVRWNDVNSQAMDPQGNTITIDVNVVVDQDIDVGSLMWLGGIDDLPGTAFVPESNVMQVKIVTRGLDLKGRHPRRVLKLSRYKDSLGGRVNG